MEDRIDIPQSFLERLRSDKRRLAAVVGGVALAGLLIAGLVAAQMRSRAADDMGTTPDSGGSVPTTSTSSDATGSPEATSSASATTTPGPGGTPGTPGTTPTSTPGGSPAEEPAPVRAPYLAFRKAGAIHIAKEDGSGAGQVAQCVSGAFALSPDARTLAFVDAGEGRLTLVNVASGKQTVVGPALDAPVSWAPDSGALAYTAGNGQASEVYTVKADGTGSIQIGPGHTPRFSGDGTALVRIQGATLGQAGEVVVVSFDEATTARLRQSTGLTAIEAGFGVQGVVAVVIDAGQARSHLVTGSIWGDAPGTDQWINLPVTSSADKPTTIAHLCASPDGAYLSYAEVGDDGYSRAFVYDVARKSSVALSTRRDTYPLCWSADGSRLLFVEGNAFQGEATSIMSVTPDGLGRRVVVEGGGL